MKVIIYKEQYSLEVTTLICDYFKEVHKEDYIGNLERANRMLDILVGDNHFIYLLEDKGNIIGFMTMYLFNQYTMTKDYAVVDYMYVIPKYRSGKAILWFYTTVGKVCTDLQMDCISFTFDTSSNAHNNLLAGGVPIGKAYKAKYEDIKIKYNKYMKGLKLR